MWWFNFKCVNSEEMGIIVKEMPIIPRAERNVKMITIPGRDGHLTISDDTYESVDIDVVCVIKNPYRINEISDWLTGSGDLILSLEPDKLYKAEVSGRFGFERLSKLYREFEVTFTAQPFKYEVEPQIITLEQSGTIYNPGTRLSLPIINVYGEGTLAIGGYELAVVSTSGEDYVTINSEIQECYFGDQSRNSKVIGSFPKLQTGEVEITLGEGITKVEIQGNWRWH